MSTLDELKIRIVAVIGSEKNGCTANDLCRIYKDMYGKDLNSKDYGFNDLETLLVSSAMQGEGGIMYQNGRYFATGDKNTSKMLRLIRNTKPRNAKLRRRSVPTKYARETFPSISNAPTFPDFTKAEKLPKGSQVTAKQVMATKQIVTKPQATSSTAPKSVQQASSFFTRHMGLSHDFANQQSELIVPSINYRSISAQRGCSYDSHSDASSSGIQLQPHNLRKNRVGKSQKGKRRLIRLIERHGGEMSFSEMENSYLQEFGVPLNSTEICRLLNAEEREIQDLYGFLKNSLYRRVMVTKLEADDLLLTVIDDEDDIDEIENDIFIDSMIHKSPLSESDMVQKDISHDSFSSNQRQYEFQNHPIDPITSSLAKTGTTTNSYHHNSQFPLPTTDDKYEYWKGPTLVSTIRSRDDYLPYKVLGDKVLSFVRAKGSFKVSDLSEIFYEEDGRYIDPKKYPEGTWENIIRKLLLDGRHPELTVRDGILDIQKDFQKSTFPFAHLPNYWTSSTQNENERPMSLSSDNGNVPAAIIYDILREAGKPLSQKELLEKLSAKGIKVNACQLTVKLITKFKDVFCCKFYLAGALISLAHGAKRPEEPNVSPYLPSFLESVKIVTHVMSDYCSTTESAGSIFKPVILINIVLIDEPPDRFRIQAFFRLRSIELAYNSFEKKMRHHYLSYGHEKDYAVEKPIKDCNYAFHDTKDNQVYRVQIIGDGDHAGVTSIYLIDEMRYQNVPVSQLRKLIKDYAEPAYGVIAKTAAFMIVPGRESEFRGYFSLVRSKLLENITQDIQADVISEPSKNLFELKQLYSDLYDNLNVPATFVRQGLIQMISSKA
ncbi:OST-HTH/LOTUS domain family protein [Acanthocheilonema viteae]|uniref:HTH OST-type domain-containing protein n=1 Tax=Acanthocheilonema viteae TaxID=6277 RepID=A0A498SJ45_ACAVI|nr:unnamed protein product [Acanthocheilonema viteae]